MKVITVQIMLFEIASLVTRSWQHHFQVDILGTLSRITDSSLTAKGTLLSVGRRGRSHEQLKQTALY